MPTDAFVALCTFGDVETARNVGREAVTRRLAACANMLPQIESIYRWKDRIEQGSEVLVLFKTTRAKIAALQEFVLQAHPYETPEFIATPIDLGAPRYLAWIADSTTP